MSFPSTRSAKWVWSRARAVRPGPSHARDERFNKKIEYIRYNQVRAGLARKPDQWAHVHFHDWVGKEPVGGGPGRTVLPPRVPTTSPTTRPGQARRQSKRCGFAALCEKTFTTSTLESAGLLLPRFGVN
jgi:hypothetical protein